jgi:hypothetical protein
VSLLFDGNFNFLGMAAALVRTAERERERDRRDASGPGSLARSETGAAAASDYRRVIDRIRRLVADHVSLDQTVVVVSRGDDELLNLGGRRASHFPQGPGGVYAGYHPADSAYAVRHLEELRAWGADVFLLPVTAFWWLRYYDGFANHLEENYRILVRQDDACLMYALNGGRALPVQHAARDRSMQGVRRVATALRQVVKNAMRRK